MLNRTSLLVGFTALAFVAASFAASDNNVDPKIEKRVERIAKKLNLSAEQAESLAVVMREQAAKRKALRDETQSRIDALLNDEQRAQVADFREHRKERRQARGGLQAEKAKTVPRHLALPSLHRSLSPSVPIRSEMTNVRCEHGSSSFDGPIVPPTLQAGYSTAPV